MAAQRKYPDELRERAVKGSAAGGHGSQFGHGGLHFRPALRSRLGHDRPDRRPGGHRGRRARREPRGSGQPRRAPAATALLTLSLRGIGVRSSVLRFAPTVHGDGDNGFVATLVGIARQRGVAGNVGDGTNRWPAVHRSDAARLARLAVEAAPPARSCTPSRTRAFPSGRSPGRWAATSTSRRPRWLPKKLRNTSASWPTSSPWIVPSPQPSPGSCSDGSRPGRACSKTSSKTTTTARCNPDRTTHHGCPGEGRTDHAPPAAVCGRSPATLRRDIP